MHFLVEFDDVGRVLGTRVTQWQFAPHEREQIPHPIWPGQGRDGVDIIFDMPCQRRRAAPSAHFYVVSIHISVMALVYVRVHAPTNLSVFMPRNCQQLLSNAYGKREEFANKEETIINLVGVGDSQPSLSASRDKRFLVRAPLSLSLAGRSSVLGDAVSAAQE